MERDEETEDPNEDSGEDSDVDAESHQEDQDSGNEFDDIPHNIRGSHRRVGVSHKHAGASNPSKTSTRNQGTKDSCKGGRQKRKKLAYEFCPLPHRPSILRLLVKHFCQHPLLPERHGQPRTPEQIHRDSVCETYLHCERNCLHEVWAYLWTNWYAPDKWRLWARLAYPRAIPRKRTTMVVEAMWRNFKRLVLYLHNRPRVDFATYALVTQALPAYRNKVVRILDDPRKGWAATINGKQIPIKKHGSHSTPGNMIQIFSAGIVVHRSTIHTFSASTLLTRSVFLPQNGGPLLCNTTSCPSMTSVNSYHLKIEPKCQSLRS